MYAFSHISSFSLTSRSPKTRPKTRVILPKRPKPKKPKKGRPVQSLTVHLPLIACSLFMHKSYTRPLFFDAIPIFNFRKAKAEMLGIYLSITMYN